MLRFGNIYFIDSFFENVHTCVFQEVGDHRKAKVKYFNINYVTIILLIDCRTDISVACLPVKTRASIIIQIHPFTISQLNRLN